MIDIERIEKQLKMRLKYNYKREKIQNNIRDKKTKFIYQTPNWDDVVKIIKNTYEEDTSVNKESLFNYAANRRYNFRSAYWVEAIFKSHPKVKENPDKFDKFVDFYILDIPFDHKTSVYPSAYNKSIEYAKENRNDLINRLYLNQSRQQRFHMKNRLFIVVYSQEWNHRKIKSELNFLKKIIYKYLDKFDINNLYSFASSNGKVFSDIIWAIK